MRWKGEEIFKRCVKVWNNERGVVGKSSTDCRPAEPSFNHRASVKAPDTSLQYDSITKIFRFIRLFHLFVSRWFQKWNFKWLDENSCNEPKDELNNVSPDLTGFTASPRPSVMSSGEISTYFEDQRAETEVPGPFFPRCLHCDKFTGPKQKLPDTNFRWNMTSRWLSGQVSQRMPECWILSCNKSLASRDLWLKQMSVSG